MERSDLSTIPARIAWGTSVLFSPFLVPIATAIGVIQKHAAPQNVLRWLAIVVLFVTVLPVLSIAVMVRYAKVSDLHLHNREERLLPLCCTLVSMVVGTVLLHQLGAAREIVWAGIAYIVNSVIFFRNYPDMENKLSQQCRYWMCYRSRHARQSTIRLAISADSADCLGAGLPETTHTSPNGRRRSARCWQHGIHFVYGKPWGSKLEDKNVYLYCRSAWKDPPTLYPTNPISLSRMFQGW
jgi:hypothetical protein